MSRKYELVSVDVWDTILRRTVHPDEVKVHTARWLQLHHAAELKPEFASDLRALFRARCASEGAVGAAAKAEGHDDEYLLEDVYRHWLATVARSVTPTLVHELEEAELEFERANTTLDPGIVAALEPYAGTPLVIASDFYMSARPLEALVRRAGFTVPLHGVYVSADHRLNKRSGRLFEKIQRDFGVHPTKHLHIGDNPRSDVEVPRRLGMAAVHYRDPVAERTIQRTTERFRWRETRSGAERLHHQARRAVRLPSALSGGAHPLAGGSIHDARECFALGVRYGLPFFAFVYAVVEDALRAKQGRVHYFTREGVFFEQIHRVISAERPLPGAIPTSDVVAVSRVSTFCASLASPTTDELMRLWNLYSTQSMGALLTTLGLSQTDYAPLFARHGIDPKTPIQYPWQDERVKRLFADEDFTRKLGGAIAERRELLLAYLARHGIRQDTPRIAIVDIGWRGTIQDNLAALLPDTRVVGHYLALNRFLNPQPANVEKRGVFCDVNQGAAPHVALEWPSVVEMLCNSATGSALGYARGDGDDVTVRTESDPAEDRVFHAYTTWFQAGVLALAAPLCHALRGHHVEAAELVETGRRHLAELVTEPPHVLTRAYFQLRHNEGFGLGSFVQKRARVPLSLRALEESGWPQGLLRYFRLTPLGLLYNRRVLRLDADGGVHRA